MNREEYEKRMKNEKYKALSVTTCEDEKEYVFISYRGDSWEKVLTDIVYKLQKKYGVRVYFDKEFSSETNSWLKQFRKNMDSKYCKACLCFFDEGYVTSYATLIELMHAMNPKSKLADAIFPISFPIDWKKLDEVEENTGLGVEDQSNPGWEAEKEVFDYEFDLIKVKYPRAAAYYYKGTEFRKCDCKDIMAIIQPSNKREYVDEEAYYLQYIIEPLRKKCPEVFENITEEKKEEISKEDSKKEDIMAEDSKGKISENTTLKQFEKMCESRKYCLDLREIREEIKNGTNKDFKVGYMDYLMASLLRGCDSVAARKNNIIRRAAYNYCVYVVSKNLDLENLEPEIGGIQGTWTSRTRDVLRKEDMPAKFLYPDGKVRSGSLGEYSKIFEALDVNATIGDVLEKYKKEEKGFRTINNDYIYKVWDLMKNFESGQRKSGLEELL